MNAWSRRQGRSLMVAGAWAYGVAAGLSSCVGPLPIEGAICPCVAKEFQCCNGHCMAKDQSCASPDASADQSALVDTLPSEASDSGAADRPAQMDQPIDPSADDVPDARAGGDAAQTPWRVLEGVPNNDMVAEFALRWGGDGSLFLAETKPAQEAGGTRDIVVFRHDGARWTQVGAALPESFSTLVFTLGPGDTPYVLGMDGIEFLPPAADPVSGPPATWTRLPALPTGISLVFTSTMEFDRAGRLHVLVIERGKGPRVVRRVATGWELLGQPGGLGMAERSGGVLGFSSTSAFLALTDTLVLRTNVFQLGAGGWQKFGGNDVALEAWCTQAVAANGTVYEGNNGGSQTVVNRAKDRPWERLPFLTSEFNLPTVRPSMDVASDGTLFVAYSGDRDPGPNSLPGPLVSRLDGDRWTALPTGGLDIGVVDAVALRVSPDATPALALAYIHNFHLTVARWP